MEHKYIDINNVRLAYVEKNCEAKNSIFFIHGNSGSSEMWHKQFESELANHYRIVAIDLPGHGHSSPAINPKEDYTPAAMAAILSHAVKILSNENPFILAGFSYGSNLAAEMLSFLNPCGIVLIAACVIGKGYGMDVVFGKEKIIYLLETASKEDVTDFLSSAIQQPDDREIFIKAYFQTDTVFRKYLLQSVPDKKVSDEIELLRNYHTSMLIVNGDNDKMINTSYLEETPIKLWQDKVFKLENTGHFVPTDTPDVVNQLLGSYADYAFKSNHS
ncbi:MAG TPA: alpha/beta hydrolase [Parafilimonas sp.]|nr:alpha/beta hydrolase [Parafilimonas sp.]